MDLPLIHIDDNVALLCICNSTKILSWIFMQLIENAIYHLDFFLNELVIFSRLTLTPEDGRGSYFVSVTPEVIY